MTFKGTELKTPGMEITRFLTWSGHNGLLPPCFSPGAQGIGQLQAGPSDSSSFGQGAGCVWSLLPGSTLHVNRLLTVLDFIIAFKGSEPPGMLISWLFFILFTHQSVLKRSGPDNVVQNSRGFIPCHLSFHRICMPLWGWYSHPHVQFGIGFCGSEPCIGASLKSPC